MLQHANVHTHPHTRVCMVYIYFCICLCWEPWVAPIPTRPCLYRWVSAVSFHTGNFLTTSWLQPAVRIFAYGIGCFSNKCPVASTVPFPVGTPSSSPISYFCLPPKLWYPMPGQSPSCHCTKTSLYPLEWDPPPTHTNTFTGPLLPFGNSHRKQLLAGPGGTGLWLQPSSMSTWARDWFRIHLEYISKQKVQRTLGVSLSGRVP